MEKKDLRITVRLSKSDAELLQIKIAEAGYKSVGAFVRDTVANGNAKAKIGTNVVVVARELVALAVMIKANHSDNDLLAKVRAIASANAGGVL
jgi:uncharacterized protein YwlG (UPF0340 family)